MKVSLFTNSTYGNATHFFIAQVSAKRLFPISSSIINEKFTKVVAMAGRYKKKRFT